MKRGGSVAELQKRFEAQKQQEQAQAGRVAPPPLPASLPPVVAPARSVPVVVQPPPLVARRPAGTGVGLPPPVSPRKGAVRTGSIPAPVPAPLPSAGSAPKVPQRRSQTMAPPLVTELPITKAAPVQVPIVSPRAESDGRSLDWKAWESTQLSHAQDAPEYLKATTRIPVRPIAVKRESPLLTVDNAGVPQYVIPTMEKLMPAARDCLSHFFQKTVAVVCAREQTKETFALYPHFPLTKQKTGSGSRTMVKDADTEAQSGAAVRASSRQKMKKRKKRKPGKAGGKSVGSHSSMEDIPGAMEAPPPASSIDEAAAPSSSSSSSLSSSSSSSATSARGRSDTTRQALEEMEEKEVEAAETATKLDDRFSGQGFAEENFREALSQVLLDERASNLVQGKKRRFQTLNRCSEDAIAHKESVPRPWGAERDVFAIKVDCTGLRMELGKNFEPYFCTLALYEISPKHICKLSEDFAFEVNDAALLKALDPTEISADPLTTLRSCVFKVPAAIPEVHMVLKIYRVARCQDFSDKVFAPYVKPKTKGKEFAKMQKDLSESLELEGFGLRQPFAWAAVPLFTEQLTLRQVGPSTITEIRPVRLPLSDTFLTDVFREKDAKFLLSEFSFTLTPLQARALSQLPGLRSSSYASYSSHPPAPSLSQSILSVQRFVLDGLGPFTHYVNSFYIYPESLFLKGNTNIQIEMQLKGTEAIDGNIPAIYDRCYAPKMLGSTVMSTVSPREKKSYFWDEVKVELPARLTHRHHMLFKFWAVEKKKKKTMLGWAVLPFGKCVDAAKEEYKLHIVPDGRYTVTVNAGDVPGQYLQQVAAPLAERAGGEKVRSKSTFTFSTRLMSCVHSNNPKLADFFDSLEDVTAGADDDKGMAGWDFFLGKDLEKAVDGIRELPNAISCRFLPVLLNQLFRVMCTRAEESAKSALPAIIATVQKLVNSVGRASAHEYLSSYVHYVFDNPIGAKRPVFSELCRHWCSLLEQSHVDLRSFEESWFLLDVLVKSMYLHVYDTEHASSSQPVVAAADDADADDAASSLSSPRSASSASSSPRSSSSSSSHSTSAASSGGAIDPSSITWNQGTSLHASVERHHWFRADFLHGLARLLGLLFGPRRVVTAAPDATPPLPDMCAIFMENLLHLCDRGTLFSVIHRYFKKISPGVTGPALAHLKALRQRRFDLSGGSSFAALPGSSSLPLLTEGSDAEAVQSSASTSVSTSSSSNVSSASVASSSSSVTTAGLGSTSTIISQSHSAASLGAGQSSPASHGNLANSSPGNNSVLPAAASSPTLLSKPSSAENLTGTVETSSSASAKAVMTTMKNPLQAALQQRLQKTASQGSSNTLAAPAAETPTAVNEALLSSPGALLLHDAEAQEDIDFQLIGHKFEVITRLTESPLYIAWNQVRPGSIADIASVKEIKPTFWQWHPLVGEAVHAVNQVLVLDVSNKPTGVKETIRKMAIYFRNLLGIHLRSVGSSISLYRDVVAMYFPFIPMLVTATRRLEHAAVEFTRDVKRSWLFCFLHILHNTSLEHLSAYLTHETNTRLASFLSLLVLCLDVAASPEESIDRQKENLEAYMVTASLVQRFIKTFQKKIVNSNDLVDALFRLVHTFIQTTSSKRLYVGCMLLELFAESFPTELFRNRNNYCMILISELFRHCSSRNAALRRLGSALYFKLLLANYETEKAFGRISVHAPVAISQLVGGSALQDAHHLTNSLEAVVAHAEATLESSSPEQVQAIKDSTSKLISLIKYNHTISRVVNSDVDLTVDLYCKISNSYLDSPDTRVQWLENLASYHEQNNNFLEAAQCKIHHASLVTEFLHTYSKDVELMKKRVPLGREQFLLIAPNIMEEPGLPSQDDNSAQQFQLASWSLEGLCELLSKAVALVEQSGYIELCLELYSLLAIVQKSTRDYPTLANTLSRYSAVTAKLMEANKGTRILARFYRVSFYGEKVGENNGREFIYKRSPASTLQMFNKAMTDALLACVDGSAEQVVRLQNKAVEQDELNPAKVYFQVASVTPFTEGDTTSIFDENFNTDEFLFETVVEKTRKKKTIFRAEKKFPFIKGRLLVVDKKDVVLTPLESAIELLEGRIVAIKLELNHNPPRVNGLQQIIQGSVVPTVNEGPLKICNDFLTPASLASFNPDLIQQLRDTLAQFTTACGFAIKLCGRIINEEHKPLQDVFEKKYEELREQINSFL